MSPRLCLAIALLAAVLLAACGPSRSQQTAAPTPSLPLTPTAITTLDRTTQPAAPTAALAAPGSAAELAALTGSIAIDGSSTVFPITEAAATAFRTLAPGVTIALGVSGTGGGFRRFCAGETVISDASRPIKADEAADCTAAGIGFIELPIAYDGISLVVNAGNDWAQCLTSDDLRRIWEPAAEGQVMSWRDVRPEWPDVPLALYGAGPDSGTFDYFTAAIVGEEGQIRADYTGSEDDYLLAQDITEDPGALGFLGYAYMVEYTGHVRAVAVDSGEGCVAPDATTIDSGRYQPLARPIFIYVRADALSRPEVAAFVTFYLANAPALVQSASYIPLTPRVYELVRERLVRRQTGSVFQRDVPVGVSVQELLELERSN